MPLPCIRDFDRLDVETLLNGLKPRNRLVLELFMAGFSASDIARKFGVSTSRGADLLKKSIRAAQYGAWRMLCADKRGDALIRLDGNETLSPFDFLLQEINSTQVKNSY